MSGIREAFRKVRVLAQQAVGIEPRIHERLRPRLEFHGNSEGGWSIVERSLNPDSVVVDIGLGEDMSFSESIISQYGCFVHGFDPTPRAVQYVNRLANDHVRLFPVGVGTAAGRVPFYLPNNQSHVSGSLTPEGHLGQRKIEVDVVTLGEIWNLLDVRRIDLLKLDIEGTEYELIDSPDFHRRAGTIGQLCVEFHHRWKRRGKEATERAVGVLEELGFACAWYSRSTNQEFLFIGQAFTPRQPPA